MERRREDGTVGWKNRETVTLRNGGTVKLDTEEWRNKTVEGLKEDKWVFR